MTEPTPALTASLEPPEIQIVHRLVIHIGQDRLVVRLGKVERRIPVRLLLISDQMLNTRNDILLHALDRLKQELSTEIRIRRKPFPVPAALGHSPERISHRA